MMAYDYALVHLKFTIPLAGLLSFILRPLLSRADVYKTCALIIIAFAATLPWDSYLIRRGVWTYPSDAIVGPRLWLVPAEELFFFIIQTYTTSLIYVLCNKPSLHARYLANRQFARPGARRVKILGQGLLLCFIAAGACLVHNGGKGTYLGLILVWACPFALLTWTLSGYFVVQLPLVCTGLPVILPTLYLWVVDELALGRGTWSIESGTKLGWCLWGSLEVEEAVFFLATNVLIVLGLVAFDSGLAVLNTFPEQFPEAPIVPSSKLLLRAVLTDSSKYNMGRVNAIKDAVHRLECKSRSFYLASSVFPGRLRVDLVLLYSFCRVADDLVDDSTTRADALDWIQKLHGYLDQVYSSTNTELQSEKLQEYISTNFPTGCQSALRLLPSSAIPSEPLYELLEGFKMDLAFSSMGDQGRSQKGCSGFPIRNVQDLELYASRVASTVGELCLRLVFHHSAGRISSDKQSILVIAARTMGYALQYVNIARDIKVDAEMGRVYIPTNWIQEEGLEPEDVLRDPDLPAVAALRERLLTLAFKEYSRSRPIMDVLPSDVRGPLIVAVESYMEIGRVLREQGGVPAACTPKRATVPRWRRVWVAWNALTC
ncbi:Phytoene synthase [Xylariales sp. PMI_506]|nr:Phytoene synthase [Xylariales sp. PMI_506]